MIARVVDMDRVYSRSRRAVNVDAAGLSFAGRLRAERQRRGWSQQQLAQVAGLSVHAVRASELEQSEPRAYTLALLADALDCGMDWLWFGHRESES